MFRWSAVQISVSRQYGSKNVGIDFKKFVFLQCLEDLHFKYIFLKQSESDIKVKVGSGSEINHFGSTTLATPTSIE